MFIQTENTPNPATVKFLPGYAVMADGQTADFRVGGDISAAPLAARLFHINGVERVFLGADFIAVTIQNPADWPTYKSLVLTALLDHTLSGEAIFIPDRYKTPGARQADSMHDAIVAQIIELIETRVRPAVAGDGGDITFSHFDNGVVYVHMRGACAGCPSSTITLKSGIEKMMKHYIPEVTEIRAVDEGLAA